MKKCKHCGEEFEPNHGKQVYCSDKCKMAFSRAQKRIAEELKDLPPLPFPIPDKPLFPDSLVKMVEDYCGAIGMTPEELIEDHKRMSAMKSLPVVKIKEEPNKVIVNDLNEQARPKGGYDPFKNPRFTGKMGQKQE